MKNFFKMLKSVFSPPKSPKIVTPKPKQSPKVKGSNTKGGTYKEVYRHSPHQSGTIKPKYIILHDSYGSYGGGVSWIQDPKSKVSYHYLIDSKGNRTQFVYDSKKAWHAGDSKWNGINGMNSHSIGVAFWGNTYKRAVNFEEIDSCARKCVYLMDKFGIPKSNILTHQMISPNRKKDTSPRIYKRVLKRIDELT